MRANLAITAHERLTTHTLPSSGSPGRLPPRGKAFVKGTALRTKRTLLNMAYALGSSLLLLLLGLVTRRLLVDNFGPQITTASQVVSQLFNFFSIAEFGVGSVISYRLYEQIAAKNEEKISKYMSMYKWAYRVVGLVIAGLALIGAAALRWIMPDVPAATAYTVYGLNVISTLCSYFLITRRPGSRLLCSCRLFLCCRSFRYSFLFRMRCALGIRADKLFLLIFPNLLYLDRAADGTELINRLIPDCHIAGRITAATIEITSPL